MWITLVGRNDTRHARRELDYTSVPSVRTLTSDAIPNIGIEQNLQLVHIVSWVVPTRQHGTELVEYDGNAEFQIITRKALYLTDLVETKRRAICMWIQLCDTRRKKS